MCVCVCVRARARAHVRSCVGLKFFLEGSVMHLMKLPSQLNGSMNCLHFSSPSAI